MTCGCCGTSCVSARPACVARRRRSMPACRWRSLRRSWGTGRRVPCSLTWASQRTTCGRPASRWSRDLLLRGSRTQHPRSAARSGGMAVVRSDRDRVSRSPFGLAVVSKRSPRIQLRGPLGRHLSGWRSTTPPLQNANAQQETYNSNTQNNHAPRGGNLYRGIPALGWHMGMVSAITRYGAGAGR